MYEFVKRFDEIMDFFKKKRKNKQKQYDRIMVERDKIFITKIPIYSAVLRDVFFSNEEYSYTKVDKCYNALYGNVCHINAEDNVGNYNIAKLNKNLFRAQKNLNAAWDLIFTSIHENEGLIRRNVLGGRMNFSSRCVIVPDSSLRSYEVVVPYVCFVELYKPDIINLLVKLDGISYNKAVDRWFKAYRDFDSKVYSIIQYIIKNSKDGCRIMLNRNPTINMGSYLEMEIKDVKSDYTDLSCSLPIQCLQSLNADFDGDVLNVIRMITVELKRAFGEIFFPRTGFMIDRNTGLFNEDFGLIKDQRISLYRWATI